MTNPNVWGINSGHDLKSALVDIQISRGWGKAQHHRNHRVFFCDSSEAGKLYPALAKTNIAGFKLHRWQMYVPRISSYLEKVGVLASQPSSVQEGIPRCHFSTPKNGPKRMNHSHFVESRTFPELESEVFEELTLPETNIWKSSCTR